MHRYLAEFDFRYSQRVRLGVDDVMRAGRVLSRVSREAVDLSNGSLREGIGMAEKPKPKPRAKAKPRSKPHFDDKAQSERFIEAARELGIDQSGELFERAVLAVVSAPPRQKQ